MGEVHVICIRKVSRISLGWKLVPVYYRKYEYGLLYSNWQNPCPLIGRDLLSLTEDHGIHVSTRQRHAILHYILLIDQ